MVCQLSPPLSPMRVEEVWATFDPMGWMSHVKTCLLGAGIHLSLCSGSASPLHLAPWSGLATRSTPMCSIVSDPCSSWLPGPFARTVGGGSMVSCSHLSPLILLLPLPPFLILGVTFNPLEEGSTGESDVLHGPHSLGIFAPLFGCIAGPMRWEGSKLWRV